MTKAASFSNRAARFTELLLAELRENIGDARQDATKVPVIDVAEAIGIDRANLSSILAGRRILRVETYLDICEAADLNPYHIVEVAYRNLVVELGPAPPVT